jgi:hypothetical protein
MRDDADLLKIMKSVENATPAMLPPPPIEQRSLFYTPVPEIRRAMNLTHSGRFRTLNNLIAILSNCTDTPVWLAQMAMDAAMPADHEGELDEADNHLPLLSRAVAAMGLDLSLIAQSAQSGH